MYVNLADFADTSAQVSPVGLYSRNVACRNLPVKGVPNALTVGRILVTPVLVLCLFQDTLKGQAAALALLAVAAFSDYLDGRLARKLKAASRLGRFLDPMADKILVIGTFVGLAILHPTLVPWWAVGLIAARDIVVSLLRIRAERQGKSLRTLPVAKVKTTLQLTYLVGFLVLLTGRYLEGTLGEVSESVLSGVAPLVALLAVVGITILTGLLYAFGTESYVQSAE